MAIQTKKRRVTPARVIMTILKVLYFILFAVAAFIVVLYIAYKVVIKPPELENTVVEVPINATELVDNDAQPSPAPVEDPDAETSTTPEPTPQVTRMVRKEEFYTFLLMGSDDGNGNADTIMVGSYDVKNGKVSVLSVPRDTLVDVSRTVKKINAAYGAGGVEQVMDEVSDVLGFQIDHYLKVDIRAFKAIVNQLGGVSFYVPCDMHHNDGAGFIIDLKQGTQWLDGDKALQLVRYRGYVSADIGRIQTQQKFLQQLAKQLVSRSSLSDINAYAKILDTYLDTDLSLTELVWFGSKALYLDFSNDITFGTLPGDGSARYKGVSSYYELYPTEALELINATVNPYTTDITPDMVNMFQVP